MARAFPGLVRKGTAPSALFAGTPLVPALPDLRPSCWEEAQQPTGRPRKELALQHTPMP